MNQTKMIKKFLILFCVIFISLTVKSQNPESVDIYVTTLKNINKYEHFMISYLLQEKSKQDQAKYKWLKGIYSELDSTTISDFKEKNKTQIVFDSIFAPTIKTIISEKELSELNGWTNINKKYGKFSMILKFSKIGFNKDKTQAFVCYSEDGGINFPSGGHFVILEKRNEKWEVARKIGTTVY